MDRQYLLIVRLFHAAENADLLYCTEIYYSGNITVNRRLLMMLVLVRMFGTIIVMRIYTILKLQGDFFFANFEVLTAMLLQI